MKCYIILLLVFLSACKCTGQTTTEKCKYYYDVGIKENIYTYVDIPAEYPEGMNNLMRLLFKTTSTTYFTKECLPRQISISIFIAKNGKVLKTLINNCKCYPSLEKKILKMLQKEQYWIPAKCHGKKVASVTIIPLNFEFTHQ